MERAVRAVLGERVALRQSPAVRGGIAGTRVEVMLRGKPLVERGGPDPQPDTVHAGGPAHTGYREITSRIAAASLDPAVRDAALRTFQLLGEVEAALHDTDLDHVHFHEVGSIDAVADVVGTAAGVHALGLTALYHGTVNLGGGTVRAAHGELPVPAPATLRLLEGRPCRFEEGAGELATPTGAALLVALAEPAPAALTVTPQGAGYGAGRADPRGRPNLVRLTVGDAGGGTSFPRVAVLECALDDATPEDGGYLMARLFERGAKDVTLSPLVMKKQRPGFLLRVVAAPEDAERLAAEIIQQSSTLGVRWRLEERLELERRVERIEVSGREMRVKVARLPGGGERAHPEHDDLAAWAAESGRPLAELRREVEAAWARSR
jgi:uncharacterized protein (TIGR00299 family) protein